MLGELSRVQEVVQQLDKHTADPKTLPPASEQVIADLKTSDAGWCFQTPPSSPSSLGSRKSSMCSISSLNSSSSGSSKSHHSPSHPHWHRSLSQVRKPSRKLFFTYTSVDTVHCNVIKCKRSQNPSQYVTWFKEKRLSCRNVTDFETCQHKRGTICLEEEQLSLWKVRKPDAAVDKGVDSCGMQSFFILGYFWFECTIFLSSTLVYSFGSYVMLIISKWVVPALWGTLLFRAKTPDSRHRTHCTPDHPPRWVLSR